MLRSSYRSYNASREQSVLRFGQVNNATEKINHESRRILDYKLFRIGFCVGCYLNECRITFCRKANFIHCVALLFRFLRLFLCAGCCQENCQQYVETRFFHFYAGDFGFGGVGGFGVDRLGRCLPRFWAFFVTSSILVILCAAVI